MMFIITHKNIDKVIHAIRQEPPFQEGSGGPIDPDAWYCQAALLEFPMGELAEGTVKTLALVGPTQDYRIESLTGKEQFNAQGLEGKVVRDLPLIEAVIKLGLLPPYRGRILFKGKLPTALN